MTVWAAVPAILRPHATTSMVPPIFGQLDKKLIGQFQTTNRLLEQWYDD